MIFANVSEAKAQLSMLLERVRNGEEVILGKSGRPIAKLVPYDGQPGPRRPGALRGQIKIAPDFDELPPDIAALLGAVE
ncbi:MAG: type II toxin-antitoxin system prevent-host-death family antitoxin [Myxococcota bacterium]